MQFDPKDVSEQPERKLIAEGEYDFEVIDAENTVFESDGEEHKQIKLKLRIFCDEGTIVLNTWVGYPVNKLWRLRDFCRCVGLVKAWESGEVTPDDCVGKAGECVVGIWKERNTIRKFLQENHSEANDPAGRTSKGVKATAGKFYSDIDEAAKEEDFPF